MELFVSTVIGFVLSFIGSLPLGMINLTVAETSIQKGKQAAILVAIGAALIEFGQAFIAVKFTHLFTDSPIVDTVIHVVAIPIFLGLGIYYLLTKTITPSTPPVPLIKNERTVVAPNSSLFAIKLKIIKHEESIKLIGKGLLISSLNLLAIPYWLFYGIYLSSQGYLGTDGLNLFFFALGVGWGTFILLLGYIHLSKWIVCKWGNVQHYANQFIGIVFLLFALFQCFTIIF